MSFIDQRPGHAFRAPPASVPELAVAARAMAIASAREQGLPAQVNDLAALSAVAIILASPPAPRRPRPQSRPTGIRGKGGVARA